jgi:hypothetical protein
MSEAGFEPASLVFKWFNIVRALKSPCRRGRDLPNAFMNIALKPYIAGRP